MSLSCGRKTPKLATPGNRAGAWERAGELKQVCGEAWLCRQPLTPSPDCFVAREQALEAEQECLQWVPGPLALTPGIFVKEEDDGHCLMEIRKCAVGEAGLWGRGAQQDMRHNLRREPHFLHVKLYDGGTLLSPCPSPPHL